MGPMLKALGIACEDAYRLCSEQMDRNLSAGESFRLRFHLMACGICRLLPAQFSGLRALVRACEQDHGDEEILNGQLPPEAKERIFEALKNGPNSES